MGAMSTFRAQDAHSERMEGCSLYVRETEFSCLQRSGELGEVNEALALK